MKSFVISHTEFSFQLTKEQLRRAMTIEATSPYVTDECFENHEAKGGCSPCSETSSCAWVRSRYAPLLQNHQTPLVSVQAMTAPKNTAPRQVASVREGLPGGARIRDLGQKPGSVLAFENTEVPAQGRGQTPFQPTSKIPRHPPWPEGQVQLVLIHRRHSAIPQPCHLVLVKTGHASSSLCQVQTRSMVRPCSTLPSP